MGKFVKGDVVVVPFPFSDLTAAKRRPALVLAALEGNDLILCQVTSKTVKDSYSIYVEDQDFAEGSLKQPSNIRPNRIFTADTQIILYKVGRVLNQKLDEVVEGIIRILKD